MSVATIDAIKSIRILATVAVSIAIIGGSGGAGGDNGGQHQGGFETHHCALTSKQHSPILKTKIGALKSGFNLI